MKSHISVAAAALAVIGLLVGPSIAAFQEEVTIRYRWTQGETLRYRSTQQSVATMSGLPGGVGDMTVDQTVSQVFRSVTQEVTADATTLQQVIESVKMTMASPMGTMTFDSAAPDASGNSMNRAMTTVMTGMIGEPVTLVMSPNGAVQKVEGFTRIIEKMAANASKDPMGTATVNAMKQSFSDDALRTMMAQGFAQLPSGPVKPGDSWNVQNSLTNPMLGRFTMSVAATLKAVQGSAADRTATIVTKLVFKQDPTAPPVVNPMGLTMQMADSAGEGEILFDVSRGRLLRSTTRMAMSMTMSGSGPGGETMSLKSNGKNTITMELLPQ